MPEEDNVLVSNVLNGDISSFERLVSNYRNRIYNFVLKMTFSKEDSEDLTQEIFIRVYNNLDKYNCKWCFSTWIYKIAVNVFKTHYAKKKNKEFIEELNFFNESPAFNSDNPQTTLESKESRIDILKILNDLNFEEKTALILKYVQGFSYKEIGEILKLSPENVKVKVMRAKKKLAKIHIGM